MSARESTSAELDTGYELFIGALSVLSLVNIVLVAVLRDDATRNVVYTLDVVLSVVFLIDFLIRLARAPSRSAYLLRGYGWADLLASLPFPQIKVLRIFRLIRVGRVVRRAGGRGIIRSLIRDRAESALLSLLFIAILVLEFGSLSILRLERNAEDPNITNASDALWYVIATMSTVGYGDRFPVTNGGRQLGALIIVVGVGIFGTLAGFLTNLFLAPEVQQARADEVEAGTSLAEAHTRLRQLKELLAQQQAAIAELEHVLNRRDG